MAASVQARECFVTFSDVVVVNVGVLSLTEALAGASH